MKRRLPKVIERKLGRERAWAQYTSGDRVIEIDPRQSSKSFCNSLIHEALHDLLPNKGEAWVRKSAGMLTRILWEARFRRMER